MSVTPLAIFTICSNNYISMAKVLLESARRHHPEATFYLCLADEVIPEPGLYPDEGVEIVKADELDIADFPGFAFRYDVMEFNTALKPFMFRRLLEKGHRNVIYFDPDIEVFSRLTDVCNLLDGGASFVLTPHLTAPLERDSFPDDIGIMRAGIYNLGFLAVGASSETDTIIRWWSRRLTYQCVNDQANGIFVDQKFMDLVPGFADNARVLRATNCNVAYWNLHQRTLTGGNGQWQVDGQPLCFFHFSGISPKDLSRLSKHTDAFSEDELTPSLRELMGHYARQLLANGHGSIPNYDYAFGRFKSGTYIPTVVRQMFREKHLTWDGNPFESYEEFLHLPHSAPFGAPDALITNLMQYLHERQPWLQATFARTGAYSANAFREWYIKSGYTLLKDRRLIEPVALQGAQRAATALPPSMPARRSAEEPDVSVIGYLRLALGVGEAGRQVLQGVRQAGFSALGLPISLNALSDANAASGEAEFSDRADGRIQIFNVNADQLPHVVGHIEPQLRKDAYRICMPFWELEEFPAAWMPAFDLVDEVWAPTRFIQSMLARRLSKPVIHMPLPLSFEKPVSADRAKFKLPADAFIFFFAFDFLSYSERKNPMGLVRAYKRAFNESERKTFKLAIKALNADKVPEHSASMRDLLRAEPDVLLIEETLSRSDTLELISACDAVVSLHRSEGLGLLVAEAMALEKPVIATDYSATTEILSDRTGWPVDFDMVAVKPGQYVFPEGQVWAQPNDQHAAVQMRRVAYNRDEARRRAIAARAMLEEDYGAAAFGRRLSARLRRLQGA